jgi:hypothetical protein
MRGSVALLYRWIDGGMAWPSSPPRTFVLNWQSYKQRRICESYGGGDSVGVLNWQSS